MTPSNPDNQQPLIYRICDAVGVFHLVAPVDHHHSLDEIDGLPAALASKANAADVQTALEGKQNSLTFDTEPTTGSTNPVTSGGVKAALDNKANTSHTHNHISYSENNGVSVGDGSVHIELYNSISETGGEADITVANLPNLQRALQNPDSAPTADSNRLVTSGGVASALSAIQIDDVQFDVSQLEKGIVYTILFKNQTGEECRLEELISISRLPSSEQNISYNVDPYETRIQNGDPAALRIIRTETETYVLYDGAIFY